MKRCVAENDPSIFKILEERGMYCLLVTSTSLSAKLKLTNIPLMTNSSEIFKKNYCISYEEASRDSLSFRSGSLRLLDELDEIVKWFDGIQKAFKCYGDDLSKYSEAVSLIAKRFTSKQFPGFLDSTVTSTLSEVMISLSSLQLKSLDNMQEKMNIFATFSAHTRDVKDAKRAMDKAMEKYETFTQKLSNLSNKHVSKDHSCLSDMTAATTESKRQYILLAFEFVRRVLILQAFFDSIVIEKVVPSLNTISNHYNECKTIAYDAALKVVELNSHIPDNLESINELYNKWQDDLSNSKNNEIMEQNLAAEREKFEMEGFLNLRKPDQKWSRRYFILKNGHLSFSTSSKITSKMAFSPMIVMASYVAKTCSSIDDKRFCLEIVHQEKDATMIMQAESEEEMIRWIECLEGSKNGKGSSDIDTGVIPTSKSTNSLLLLDLNTSTRESSTQASRKKNQDFHALNLKSIPPADMLVTSFSAFLNEGNSLQGTCYVTKTRLCLYSSVLGPSKSVILDFKDILLIEKNISSASIILRIKTTSKEEYYLRTYDDDENPVLTLIDLWQGVDQLDPPDDDTTPTIMTESQLNSSVSPIPPSDASPKTDASLDSAAVTTSSLGSERNQQLPLISSANSSSSGSPDHRKYTLPPPLLPPTEDVSCDCKDHLDREEISETISASAKEVFDILFGEDARDFWLPLDKMKGVSNKKESPWSFDEASSLPTRKVDFTVPVNNPLVLSKEIEVKETTSVITRQEHFCYVVEKKSATPQVPFGDCFVTCIRFCVRWQTENTCHLRISLGVLFLKSTLMKGFIKPEALKGLGESVIPIYQRLKEVFAAKQIQNALSLLNPEVSEQEDNDDIPTTSAPPIPIFIDIPTAPVSCNCPNHLEKVEFDVVLSCTAEDAFDCLFGSSSLAFWEEMDKSNGEFNRQESSWATVAPNSLQTKQVSYWMKLDNPMLKAKQFEVKSTHTCIRREERSAYVVEMVTSTPDIPYGDCFTTETRYCITWVDRNCCRLIISSGVTFLKYTMMKAIIKINATKGLSDKSTAVIALLRSKLGRNSVLDTPDATKLELASEIAVEHNYVKSPATSVAALTPSSDNRKIMVPVTILSFVFGFLFCCIIMKPSSLNTLEKNWNHELSAPGSSRPSEKMIQFLRTHFNNDQSAAFLSSDAGHYVCQPPSYNVPYYTQLNLKEYHRLVDMYQLVHDAKQDISQLNNDLLVIEKHLIWSMYYNWRDEEIASSLKNLHQMRFQQAQLLEKMKMEQEEMQDRKREIDRYLQPVWRAIEKEYESARLWNDPVGNSLSRIKQEILMKSLLQQQQHSTDTDSGVGTSVNTTKTTTSNLKNAVTFQLYSSNESNLQNGNV